MLDSLFGPFVYNEVESKDFSVTAKELHQHLSWMPHRQIKECKKENCF